MLFRNSTQRQQPFFHFRRRQQPGKRCKLLGEHHISAEFGKPAGCKNSPESGSGRYFTLTRSAFCCTPAQLKWPAKIGINHKIPFGNRVAALFLRLLNQIFSRAQ
jgi:hypothetical protein